MFSSKNYILICDRGCLFFCMPLIMKLENRIWVQSTWNWSTFFPRIRSSSSWQLSWKSELWMKTRGCSMTFRMECAGELKNLNWMVSYQDGESPLYGGQGKLWNATFLTIQIRKTSQTCPRFGKTTSKFGRTQGIWGLSNSSTSPTETQKPTDAEFAQCQKYSMDYDGLPWSLWTSTSATNSSMKNVQVLGVKTDHWF